MSKLGSDCAGINIVNLHTLDLKILQFLNVKTLPVHPEYKLSVLYDGNAKGVANNKRELRYVLSLSLSLCAILTALI